MIWLTPNIEDICLPTIQAHPSSILEDTFRYIDISSIDRDAKCILRADELPCSEAPSRARKIVQFQDVLVSTVRPNLNAVAIVPEDLDGQIASTGFSVLRANPDFLTPRYLFFWVQHQTFIEHLCANATGASYPAVTDGVVKRSRIPFATPTEQSRIVDILDEADRLRRLSREASARAERILPALFLKMFGDPATNPKALCKKPLGEVIRVKSGDFLPAKEMAKDGQYPVYGGNGISGYHDHYMFEERKIVLGRVGAYCGVVHYSEPRAWITDNALYVSEKLVEVDDIYLSAALKLANLNQYAGRAGQPLISGSRIYPVEILLPSPDQQEVFAEHVEALNELDDNLSKATERLDHLWEVIMNRAFSGELTATWREAHMRELVAEMAVQARQLNLPMPQEAAK